MRESVVVALDAAGAEEAALWTSLLAGESGWTARELNGRGSRRRPNWRAEGRPAEREFHRFDSNKPD